MLNNIVLRIGGVKYTKWISVSINRSMMNLCGSFSLTAKNEGDLLEVINNQNVVEILCDDEHVIVGFIDKDMISINSNSSSITINGRGILCDLVDCSALNKPGTWNDLKLEALVNELVKPFSFTVLTDVDTGDRFNKFSLNSGETVFEAISRACGMRKIVPIMDSTGSLLLKEIGNLKAFDSLVLGKNIISLSRDRNYANRFRNYYVRGSTKVSSDGWDKRKISVSASAVDEEIQRYRPLQINASDNVTTKIAQEQVDWEAQIRAGKSISVKVKVWGWKQSNGKLWDTNLSTSVIAELLNIKVKLLITQVNFRYSNTEFSTNITLNDPRMFSVKPVAPKKIKTSGW